MHFGASVINPRDYFRNSIESALALVDAVLAGKVRKLVISPSCSTYGVPNGLPIAESLRKEPVALR
jgi:UDP-arabinose 4-epimerase